MATNVIYSNASDGQIQSTSSVYATALAGSSLVVTNNTSTSSLGQRFSSPNYDIWQTFLAFDCSGLTGTKGFGVIETRCTGDQIGTGYPFKIAPYSFGTLETSDWRTVAQLIALTAWGAANFTWFLSDYALVGTWMSPPSPRGWPTVPAEDIPAGTLETVLWSYNAEDVTPTADEYISIATSEDATYDPKLTVHTFTAGYPYIAGMATTADGANSTAKTINLPESIDAGDHLLMWLATDGDQTSAPTATGWTSLGWFNNSTATSGSVLYRRGDGTEGSTVAVTLSDSETAAAVVLRIKNDGHQHIVFGETATGTNAAPNPAATVALKESRKTLFLAAAAWDHNDTFSTYPANYIGVAGFNSGTGAGDCGVALAYRELEQSASEDPGTFGISGSEEWVGLGAAVVGDLSPTVVEQWPVDASVAGVNWGVLDASGDRFSFTFIPRESCSIEKLACIAAAVGSPADDLRFAIRTTESGSDVASADLSPTTTVAWYEATLSTPYAVTAGSTYYFTLYRTGSTDLSNYYRIRGQQSSVSLDSLFETTINGGAPARDNQFPFQIRKQAGATTVLRTFDPIPFIPRGRSF
jgi:hypothetical protein